jgi:uncharacterized membrane protein
MEALEENMRWGHILAGSLALGSGLMALLASQQPAVHKWLGWLFFGGMTFVFVSAVYLSVTSANVFLAVIAVLSYYYTLFGYRSMRIFKGSEVTFFDRVFVGVLAFSGITLLWIAMFSVAGLWVTRLIYIAFALLMLMLGRIAWRSLRNVPVGDKGWYRSHRTNMGGALIATFTAFTVNTFHVIYIR